MSKKRNRKARLGKVSPAFTRGQDRLFHAKADSKAVHFLRLWARKGDAITVSLADVLDFGLNRTVIDGERKFTLGFRDSGIYILEEGSVVSRTIPFRDLISLIQGQLVIPGTV